MRHLTTSQLEVATWDVKQKPYQEKPVKLGMLMSLIQLMLHSKMQILEQMELTIIVDKLIM
jgi:hypothetical protein